MKIAGIVALIFGILGTLGAIMRTIQGNKPNFGAVVLIIIGIYIINKEHKKKKTE